MCIVSKAVKKMFIDAGSLVCNIQQNTDSILDWCGGKRVYPKRVCDLQLEVYGCKMTVPMLVLPCRVDELIIGTNVNK